MKIKYLIFISVFLILSILMYLVCMRGKLPKFQITQTDNGSFVENLDLDGITPEVMDSLLEQKVYYNLSPSESFLYVDILDTIRKTSDWIDFPSIQNEDCKLRIRTIYPVSNDALNRFYQFQVVNGWCKWFEYAFSQTLEDYIRDGLLHGNIRMFYCGRILLSPTFDSYLFLLYDFDDALPDDDAVSEKRLFLVNVSEGKVMSISLMYQAIEDSNCSRAFYSKLDNNDVLHCYEKTIKKDSLNAKCDDVNIEDKGYYKFDKNGRVVQSPESSL